MTIVLLMFLWLCFSHFPVLKFICFKHSLSIVIAIFIIHHDVKCGFEDQKCGFFFHQKHSLCIHPHHINTIPNHHHQNSIIVANKKLQNKNKNKPSTSSHLILKNQERLLRFVAGPVFAPAPPRALFVPFLPFLMSFLPFFSSFSSLLFAFAALPPFLRLAMCAASAASWASLRCWALAATAARCATTRRCSAAAESVSREPRRTAPSKSCSWTRTRRSWRRGPTSTRRMVLRSAGLAAAVLPRPT